MNQREDANSLRNPPMHYLIVNADDFGVSPDVNRGIIEAHERGIVTSTSFMPRWPAAIEAAEYARAHPQFGVGLHIDLSEWICRDGNWEPLYEVVSLEDPKAVRDEIHRQLDRFRQLLGRDPDHIDSHQHAHRNEPVLSAAREIAQQLHVPLRHFSSVRYCGEFYGQGGVGEPYPELISPDALINIVRSLAPGATELCCHPARGADLQTMYLHEREIELASLCDSRVGQAVKEAGMNLCTFSSIAAPQG
jgi:chitin disaccharide deacetylase